MRKRRLHWLVCLVMMLGMMIGAAMSAQAATKTITWDDSVLESYNSRQFNGFLEKIENGGITLTSSGDGAYIRGYETDDGKDYFGIYLYFFANKNGYLTFTSTVGKITKISIHFLMYRPADKLSEGWVYDSGDGGSGDIIWTGTPAESVKLQLNDTIDTFIKIANNSGSKSYGSITFTVDDSADSTSVTSVSLNKESTSLTVGGTETLTATVSPSTASNKSVSWS